MEDSKKKPLMIIVIVICLIVAVVISLATRSKKGGLSALEGKKVLVKCRKCGASYETDHKEFQEYKIEHRSDNRTVVPVPCKECGEEATFEAVKCNKCGNVFERGSVKQKMPDTCPKCGFSQIEEDRKNR